MNQVSINLLFENSLKENWDRSALSDYNGATLYYRDVAASVAKLHILFEEFKIKKGDKIAICGRNQANWGIIFLASITYGAIAVPILHEFKPDNINYIINHSDCRLLFAGTSVWENINETNTPELEAIFAIKDFSILHCKNDKLRAIHQQLDKTFDKKYKLNFSPQNVSFYSDNPEEMAVLNYTSGTTGLSKGVMLSFRNLWSNIKFAQEAIPLYNNTGVLVSMLPLAHMYGLMFEFLFGMSVGAHVYFLTRLPTPKIIMEAFATIKPTLIISVPLIIEKIYKKQLLPLLEKTSIKMLLKLPIVDKVILNKISDKLDEIFGGRFIEIVIGGASLNREAEQFFKRIGFRYTVGYGMTEVAPLITYASWDDATIYSCGKIVSRMQIKIDSPDQENISGEILVKGDNVFMGYYKNPKATADSFTPDGWLKTGDMGTIDKHGYLFIHGRCKNMILGPSGQNIYPEEIEDLINNKPYITESLVIEQQAGKLVALVYPDYDAARTDGVSEQDIPKLLDETLKAINNELPKYSQISSIKLYHEEFEKTPKRSIKRFLYQIHSDNNAIV